MHKNEREKQQIEFRHQTDLLHTRLNVKEQSMTLISEEIHDNVGQLLSLMRMYVINLGRYVHDEDGKRAVSKTTELATKAIQELRHISHSLNSELIEQVGLVSFLQRELDYLSETNQIKCTLELLGEQYQLTQEQNLLIFRIVQESIQNVIKHAAATSLVVKLGFGEEHLQVTITDDGKGFDVAEARKSESLGFRNIYNRAQLLKADIDITSSSDNGSQTQLYVPVNIVHARKNQDSSS